MWTQVVSNFLNSQKVTNLFLGIIVITIFVCLLFHKGITRQIIDEAGLATEVSTQAAIDDLRKELKEEIKSLRLEIESIKLDIKSIKGNDLFHMNMAILLLARDAAKSEDRFNRIKDMLIEATPESKRPQMREITFR
jgi:hypothetical protein